MEQNEDKLDNIFEQFFEVNQSIFSQLEQTKRVIESVEIMLLPMEKRISIRINEHAKNTFKPHQQERPLVTQDVDFYNRIKSHLPPGAMLRHIDPTNIDPVQLTEILNSCPPGKPVNP